MEQTQSQSAVSPDSKEPSSRIAPGRTRCRARKRCRLHSDPATGLCPRHALRPGEPLGTPEDRDLSSSFSCPTNEFNSAVQINAFLSTVTDLVVRNEISARRAAVLAFITSQLLRTLPEIDRETGADQPQFIFDLPRPKREPADDSHADSSPSSDPLDAYRRLAT
jgi:hypothetical protein